MRDTRARSFVVIMIIIAVSALVLRIAIEQLIRINIVQNQSNAHSTLKLFSTALENYARDHAGSYPNNLSDLTKDNPPYLDKVYITRPSVKGYDYECSRLEASGYSCSATPVRCKLTGKMIYTVTTGGVFVLEDCSLKD